MYSQVAENDCLCCGVTNCQCAGICPLMTDTINKFKKPQCFTISPNPKDYADVNKLIEDWDDKFYNVSRHLADGIFVLELDGVRPHYHCIVDILDPIGFTKTVFLWGQYHNVKLHKMFLRGIHYLFKDVETTYNSLGVFPVVHYDDYIRRRNEQKQRRLNILSQNKINRLDVFIKETPKCFLPTYSDSDDEQ